MDMTDLKQYLIAFLVGVALVACCLVFFQIGKERGHAIGYQAGLNEPGKVDTVEVDVPVYIEKPVPVVEWRDREKLVYVPVNDTTLVTVHDTTFIALEREHKRYEGEEYEAQVSGVDPELDWIRINQKTKYITTTKTVRKHWGLGVTAGPGVLYDGNIHGGVGIVAGLQYQF